MRESLQKRVLVCSAGGWWWWWAGFWRGVDVLPSQGSSLGAREGLAAELSAWPVGPSEGEGLGASVLRDGPRREPGASALTSTM